MKLRCRGVRGVLAALRLREGTGAERLAIRPLVADGPNYVEVRFSRGV